jgi:UDP-N-acetylmuramoyl-tripeptide--D-alanyl-D-alanine ligase
VINPAWIEETLAASRQLLDSHRGSAGVSGASIDSRSIRGGEIFFALPGDNTDGHRFLDAAGKAGASALVLEEEEPFKRLSESADGFSLFRVRDCLSALQELASQRVRDCHVRVLAITGSNGKTGTKDLLAALLGSHGKTYASKGNLNNQIGLPLTLLSMPEDADYVVAEMGCSGFGEIRKLSDLFPPFAGIVTNIGEAHLEELGDLDGVFRAKSELPESLPVEGLFVTSGDEDYARALKESSPARTVFAGRGEENHYQIEDLGLIDPVQRRFRIEGLEGQLAAPSAHTLLNLSLAWALARELGAEAEAMLESLKSFQGEENRSTLLRLGSHLLMNDSYNANPSSLRVALDWLSQPSEGKCWAVLGDLLELGDDAAGIHGALGEEIAGRKIDGLLALGPLSAVMVQQASKAGLDHSYHFEDHGSLVEKLSALLGSGDRILLKGSRGMAMERLLPLLEKTLNDCPEEWQ